MVLRPIGLSDFVMNIRTFGENAEAMRETMWHIDLTRTIISQMGREPRSEGCRMWPNIDHHIVDVPTQHRHKLRLWMCPGEMHASQDMLS